MKDEQFFDATETSDSEPSDNTVPESKKEPEIFEDKDPTAGKMLDDCTEEEIEAHLAWVRRQRAKAKEKAEPQKPDVKSEPVRETNTRKEEIVLDDILLEIDKFFQNYGNEKKQTETKENNGIKLDVSEVQQEILIPPTKPLVAVRQIPKNIDVSSKIYRNTPNTYSCIDVKDFPSNLLVIDDENETFLNRYGYSPSLFEEHKIIPINPSYGLSYSLNPFSVVLDSESEVNNAEVQKLIRSIMNYFIKDYSAFDKIIVTMLVYYMLEEQKDFLENGHFLEEFDFQGTNIYMNVDDPPEGAVVRRNDRGKDCIFLQGFESGMGFKTLLKLVQEAKLTYDERASALVLRLTDFLKRTRMEEWAIRHKGRTGSEVESYFNTFLLADYKTVSHSIIKIASGLQCVANNYDFLFRTNYQNPQLNVISIINEIFMQPKTTFYLDLSISSETVRDFAIELFRLELQSAEKHLRRKWFVGYIDKKKKSPEPNYSALFGPFDVKQEVMCFYETVTEDSIYLISYAGIDYYGVAFNGKSVSCSTSKEKLQSLIKDIENMGIWEMW